MMKAEKYLSDILLAIQLIESFVEDVSEFSVYENDKKTQSAVERQLAIIGEALNKLKSLDEKSIGFSKEREIIAFRNRLVHAYDSIDNAIVWVILKKHLFSLKTEVEEKLKEKS